MSERAIFLEALRHEDPAQRGAYLEQACAGDPALRRRVDQLLQAHERAGEFLERRAVEPVTEGPASAAAPAGPSEGGPGLEFLGPPRRAGSLGRLGHYEVLERVGQGGFGIVLRALDDKLQRVVAVKVLAPELAASGTACRRFIREARATAAVRDEHVVAIYQVEDEHRPPYLVMEYVKGVSLQERLDRRGPPELREVLRIGRQVACGLAAAHAQGLVHRDVKPANVLLENGVERVKLTDFGLARAVDDASLTHPGVVAGTPTYMSPEQASGEPVGPRSDLFSLGSVLYALCTGHAPFRADSTLAVLRRVLEDEPRPVREVNPEVPDWLEAIIKKLHAKAPADRFASAQEVADLLGEHLARVQDPARPPRPAAVPAARPAKPGPAAGAGMPRWSRRGLVLVALLAAGGALGYGLWRAAHNREPAGEPAAAGPLARAPFSAAQARDYQEAAALRLGVPVESSNSVGMKLRLIPAGEFLMGSSDAEAEQLAGQAGAETWWFQKFVRQRLRGETPQHRVTLSRPFFLGVHEVTVGQFRGFVEASGYRTTAETDPRGGYGFVDGAWEQRPGFSWRNPGFEQTDEHPVGNVSATDAAAYCRWLGEREGVAYRLPTEAEWEYACRAGTATRYAGGDDDESLRRTANTADASFRARQPGADWASPWDDGHTYTSPVGRFEPNAFGLHDMHGNA